MHDLKTINVNLYVIDNLIRIEINQLVKLAVKFKINLTKFSEIFEKGIGRLSLLPCILIFCKTLPCNYVNTHLEQNKKFSTIRKEYINVNVINNESNLIHIHSLGLYNVTQYVTISLLTRFVTN